MKKQTLLLVTCAVLVMISLSCAPTVAKDKKQNHHAAELQQQIMQLQQRIRRLEAEKQALYEASARIVPPHRRSLWDPFAEMDAMRREMDHMFADSFRLLDDEHRLFSTNMSFSYDVDIIEDDKGYVITFDLPGIDQENVDIQISDHSVTVKGEHSSRDVTKGPNDFFSAQSYGTFLKTIPVPEDADTSNVSTEKTQDSVIITMPRK